MGRLVTTTDSHEFKGSVRDSSHYRLTLTEPVDRNAGTIDEDLIQVIVAAFYDAVLRDESLGPIFAERITDWPRHLARMCDFWSTIMLRSGRYAGRPLDVHAQISRLRDEHFGRWLELWDATIEHHAPPDVRSRFILPAVRMARTMAQHRDSQTTVRSSALVTALGPGGSTTCDETGS